MLENIVTPDASERVFKGFEFYFQFFQHMTTVNTGSILLLITILEKVFKNPERKDLIKLCLGGFIVSLVACISGMWFTAINIAGRGRDFEAAAAAISWLLAVGGFLVGIISLAIFSIKNLK